jgi:hypothetical protein
MPAVKDRAAWAVAGVRKPPKNEPASGVRQFLHSVNHGKPGMVSVLRNGKRFVGAAPKVGKPAGAFIFCE